jgi:hypothetical protein
MKISTINLLATVAILAASTVASAQSHTNAKVTAAAVPATIPGIAPIQSNPYGQSYGEWSAHLWQWEFMQPVTASLVFDTAGCSAGQSGPVWFLGGIIVPNSTLGYTAVAPPRTCTVPAGVSLFIPLMNTECSSMPNDAFGDASEAGLRSCAEFFANMINRNTLSVTVDGVQISGSALAQYRAESPLFQFGPLPQGNPFDLIEAPTQGDVATSVSDGYYVMLRPLSAGKHVVHFYGEVDMPDGSLIFAQDITYHLIVGR